MGDGGRAGTAEALRSRLSRLRGQVGRRRREVARLAAQVEILAAEVRTPAERTHGDEPEPELAPGIPSYVLAARAHRRLTASGLSEAEGLYEPAHRLNSKLPALRWAAQHGVEVPRVLGRWPSPDTVDFGALPDRFVLKSTVGAGGVNVFPLVRDPRTGEYTDMLTGEPTTPTAVRERLRARHHERSRYFAEEFLVGRTGEPGAVPDDIKVFCFYGEAVYLEARRGDQSRAAHVTTRVRAFAADGTELPHARALMHAGERDIATPSDIPGVVAAAERLSASVRWPMIRLDFYETDRGVVFGEFTKNPGHPPALPPEWDRRLGEAYEAGYARLLRDVAAEGALHVDLGEEAGAPPAATGSGS